MIAISTAAQSRGIPCPEPSPPYPSPGGNDYMAALSARDIANTNRRTWNGLCKQMERAARRYVRESGDVRIALRQPAYRDAIHDLGDRGYSADTDAWASRAVTREAKAVLAARDRQRADRIATSRQPATGRILALAPEYQQRREQTAIDRQRDRICRGKLSARRHYDAVASAALRGSPGLSAGAVRCLVRAVGTIGEQCERDLAEFETGEEFDGKRGKHHRLEIRSVERIQRRRDWSAVMITMRDFKQFGRGGGYNGYESRGGNSYRTYLVVRDSTTKEAHVIRVAPRYGNAETALFHRAANLSDIEWRDASPQLRRRAKRWTEEERRIHAAVASTFQVRAGEYEPQTEA